MGGVLRAGDTKLTKKDIRSVLFTFVHTYSLVQILRKMMKFNGPVCTVLFCSNRRILQSMKTSVFSILNSSLTDVFIFCNRSRSNNIKRVQTGCWLNQKILSVECVIRTRALECPDLCHLRAEHLMEWDNNQFCCNKATSST